MGGSASRAREPFLEDRSDPLRWLRRVRDGCCKCTVYCVAALLLVFCTYLALLSCITFILSEARLKTSLQPTGFDTCQQETGGSCHLFGCEDWRNARCVQGKCMCRPDECVVMGECLPQSRADVEGAPAAASRGNFTALVLSGGGAKGAFELGVLEGICQNQSLRHLRNWSMIVGTSIGALNAGALAQFPPHLQCTQALTAAQRFWDSIKAPEDVWESSGLADVVAPQDPSTIREPCMSGTHLMSMAIAFWRKGGLCDPQPGRTAFEFAVKRERIRNSGMMLRVVATSLATGRGKWWDEKSEHIIQGCEASGAMAPVIYPMEVDHEGFVDGGFVANTPIMKALEEGAQTVLVVNLDPLSMGDLIPDLKNLTKSDDSVGMRILQFELSIMQQRYFLEHELQMACSNFKDRNIIAFTPKTEPGDFLSFSGEGLKRMQAKGLETVRHTAPVDLCQRYLQDARSSPKKRAHAVDLAESLPRLSFPVCGIFLLGILTGLRLSAFASRQPLAEYISMDV